MKINDLFQQIKPILLLLAVCGALIAGISWLMSGGLNTPTPTTNLVDSEIELEGPLTPEKMEAYNVEITNSSNPIVTFNTSAGVIEIELFQDWMPITAGNFIKLAESGFYNGTKFHRVIDGFMIQGGDPNTKTDEVMKYGTGGPGYTIEDEHVKADLLSNRRGTIAMANNGQPNSGGSQFFINLSDNLNLDFNKQPLSSKHPVFGHVVTGMDVVDEIGRVETNATDLPLEDVIIESITVRR